MKQIALSFLKEKRPDNNYSENQIDLFLKFNNLFQKLDQKENEIKENLKDSWFLIETQTEKELIDLYNHFTLIKDDNEIINKLKDATFDLDGYNVIPIKDKRFLVDKKYKLTKKHYEVLEDISEIKDTKNHEELINPIFITIHNDNVIIENLLIEER